MAPGALSDQNQFRRDTTVKTALKRALGAALMLSLAPVAAPAAAADRSTYPAIATGMAIPDGMAARNAMAPKSGRYVLVDAAAARLYMMEGGAVRDSMKVIVGKPGAATPALQSSLHYATLNPYWNVPTDLAQKIIAPRVLAEGTSYLSERGYQVVSNYGDKARVLPASSVDWKAVAAGRAAVFVRQLPGPANSMGQIKFALANGSEIFLHDTPKKELFAEAERNLSNGCVRLEDADRFARWLLGNDADLDASAPEQHVALPRAVPIVITYLDQGAQSQMASLR
jgi:murein L,D-transpeptidase YcbB/YkuD